jgi:Resolvase, N terminal domain
MNATRRKPKRVALYLRVSTSEQTTRNQRRELKAVAERHGWEIVKVYEDAGYSGGKGREQRPGLDELLKAVARREIDMVAAWSVDRLGRSLMDSRKMCLARIGGLLPPRSRGFFLALASHVRRVCALIGLDVFKFSVFVTHGVKLGTLRTAVSCPLGHDYPSQIKRVVGPSSRRRSG